MALNLNFFYVFLAEKEWMRLHKLFSLKCHDRKLSHHYTINTAIMEKANSDWSFGQEFIFIARALYFRKDNACTYKKKRF